MHVALYFIEIALLNLITHAVFELNNNKQK